MALLDYEKKEGLQYGTIGDECYHCRRNRNPEEVYEPASLDRQLVYKLKIYGNEYCLCEECFKKTLGNFILLDPNMSIEEPIAEQEPEKKAPAKKSTKKKEEGEE
jgi:hypothetical protein